MQLIKFVYTDLLFRYWLQLLRFYSAPCGTVSSNILKLKQQLEQQFHWNTRTTQLVQLDHLEQLYTQAKAS